MDGGAIGTKRDARADAAPVDEEAERAVLAACLLDEGREAVVARVRALLRPEDFASPQRAAVTAPRIAVARSSST